MSDCAPAGWFFQNDLDGLAKLVNYSQADYVTMDIESFPELEPYVAVAYKSKNLKARQTKGETDSAAGLRVARGWTSGCVAAAKQVKPDVTVYMYWLNACFDRGVQVSYCS